MKAVIMPPMKDENVKTLSEFSIGELKEEFISSINEAVSDEDLIEYTFANFAAALMRVPNYSSPILIDIKGGENSIPTEEEINSRWNNTEATTRAQIIADAFKKAFFGN